MKSFVITLEKFFALNRRELGDNFDQSKKRLLIPLYQREYKWEDDKIENLIRDIASRDKFLGIIILDEKGDRYEIVDGQQRITTCFLTFMNLYNLYSGHPREQESILRQMQPCGSFLLENHSVGEYISFCNSHMEISIDQGLDVYYQNDTFHRAFDCINRILTGLKSSGQLRDFRDKFKDCKFLVLINNVHQNTSPVEQIFLDINEKAQSLDVEDIFKGHCFENYTDESFHDDLKRDWANLKQIGKQFGQFGYNDLSEYLYLYLLSTPGSFDIPQNLYAKGKHYLDGKSMDETGILIKEMALYGDSVLKLKANIGRSDYRFEDICPNSYEFRNTSDHIMLKSMINGIIEYSRAQYQKLPFFMAVHYLAKNSTLRTSMSHDNFRRIITNFFIYASLFKFKSGGKSKDIIAHDLIKVFHSDGTDTISRILTVLKDMRKGEVNNFSIRSSFKDDEFFAIYSILDNYKADKNWLTQRYLSETGFSKEHLIIPDNRFRRIKWHDGDKVFEFQLLGNRIDSYKKSAGNYLVLPKPLNELLEHDDIESKIRGIREWYQRSAQAIPSHIDILLRNIESQKTYRELVQLKGQDSTNDDTRAKYGAFLDEYFGEENQASLRQSIKSAFLRVFQNDIRRAEECAQEAV